MLWKDGDDGDDAKQARKLQDAAQNRINEYNESNNKLDAQIADARKAGDDDLVTNLEGQKTNNLSSIAELTNSITDLNNLGSNQENTFSFGGKTVSGDAGYLRKDDGVINIYNTGESKEEQYASKLHEVRHANQFLNGKMKVGKDGLIEHMSGMQVNNEISAHRVQYAYGGIQCLPSSSFKVWNIRDISFPYIANIQTQSGEFLYPTLRLFYLQSLNLK
jgi:myosin heavy subunit